MLRNEKSDFVTRRVVTPSNLREVSLRDGKCCFATRRVTSSREVVVKYLKPSRRLCRHFSQALPALLDGLCPSLLAARSRRSSQVYFAFSQVSPALLKCFVPSRGFFSPHFSNVYSLLAGFACTSRRTLVRHFPPVSPALLDGLGPSLPAVFQTALPDGFAVKVISKFAYLDRQLISFIFKILIVVFLNKIQFSCDLILTNQFHQ